MPAELAPLATGIVAIVLALIAKSTTRQDRAATVQTETIKEDRAASNTLIDQLQEQASSAEERRLTDLGHYREMLDFERAETLRSKQRVVYLEKIVLVLLRQLRDEGIDPEVIPNGGFYPDGFPKSG